MKSKYVAALLAFFFGSIGIHRFYLGQPTLGIGYIAVLLTNRWAAIILGLIDAIMFLAMSDEQFNRKYNRGQAQIPRMRRTRSQRDMQRMRQNELERRRQIMLQRQRKFKAVKKNPMKQSGIKKLDRYEVEDAIKDLEKAAEINREDPEIFYQLARAYSLIEDEKHAYEALAYAVRLGFDDMESIMTDDALAYLRIQDGFDQFRDSGFRNPPKLEDKSTRRRTRKVVPQETQTQTTSKEKIRQDSKENNLLEQLQQLSQQRKEGLLTQEEFNAAKRKLLH